MPNQNPSIPLPPGGTYPGGPEEGGHFDLFQLFGEVWQKKGLILGPALLLALIAFVVLNLMTPRFMSEAQILVENRENAFTQPVQDGVLRAERQSLLDQEAVRSQVQLLRSRDIALAVTARLDLTANPEFDPLAEGFSPVKRVFVLLGLVTDPSRQTPEERVLETFQKRLDVYSIAQTRVIGVRFKSKDPQLAADVVNAVVDEYLSRQRDAKQSTTRDATAWLSEQIEELRREVEEAEAKVAAFRSETGILLGLNDASLGAQQLTELNSQLIAARAQRSEAQARAQMIQAMLRSGEEIDGSSDVLQSPLVSRLQEQLITLQASEAELSSTFLPGHPRLRETRAEISGLRAQIRAEMTKIVRGLESEAEVAAARERAINASLESLKEEVAETGSDEVQLRALEREAKARRDLLETLLARFREASARENPNASPADARVISRPLVSNVPAVPNTLLVISAVFVVTALVAAGLVFATALARAGRHMDAYHAMAPASREHEAPMGETYRAASFDVEPAVPEAPMLEQGQRSKKPLNERLDELVSASRASIEAMDDGRRASVEDAEELPLSAGHVDVETVHTGHGLERAVTDKILNGGKRVMVTTARKPGLSPMIAMALVRSLVAQEARAIMVDSCFEGYALAESPGLGGLLSGTHTFSEVIETEADSGAHVIHSGLVDIDPILLAGSERFQTVFQALDKSYDAIVVAAPPINTHPEGRMIAAHVDQVVLVVMPDGEERAVERARRRLADSGVSDVILYIPNSTERAQNDDRAGSALETA